jgi:hypothetical protein
MGFWANLLLGPRHVRRRQWASWQSGRTEVTLRGEVVASQAERRIGDCLHAAGVAYLYEPRIAGFRPDFYLPDLGLIVEYWGMDPPGSPHRQRKVAAYRREGYSHINLENSDWWTLEETLLRKLYRWDTDVFRRYRASPDAQTLPA